MTIIDYMKYCKTSVKTGLISLYILSSFLIFSCECVPGIETDKKITPKESTDAAFINCTSDNTPLTLYSNSVSIEKSLANNQNNVNYSKFYIGDNFLQVEDDHQSLLYSGLLNFAKGNKYSVFAFGRKSRLRVLSILDSLPKNIMSGFRFINLNPESKSILVQISGYDNKELKFRSYTDVFPLGLSPISYSITDIETNNLLRTGTILFRSNSLINMILTEGSEPKSVLITTKEINIE